MRALLSSREIHSIYLLEPSPQRRRRLSGRLPGGALFGRQLLRHLELRLGRHGPRLGRLQEGSEKGPRAVREVFFEGSSPPPPPPHPPPLRAVSWRPRAHREDDGPPPPSPPAGPPPPQATRAAPPQRPPPPPDATPPHKPTPPPARPAGGRGARRRGACPAPAAARSRTQPSRPPPPPPRHSLRGHSPRPAPAGWRRASAALAPSWPCETPAGGAGRRVKGERVGPPTTGALWRLDAPLPCQALKLCAQPRRNLARRGGPSSGELVPSLPQLRFCLIGSLALCRRLRLRGSEPPDQHRGGRRFGARPDA